ncbi:unnamed protein product [Moneuplotes crassus]|uniref:Uncharacterized protein n=1 Tax=Euplotes crassus TaxID=5936 RepID=A0AAD1U4I3_EUPCR|nr:unnamed protein product [Moneuplotes crassus]
MAGVLNHHSLTTNIQLKVAKPKTLTQHLQVQQQLSNAEKEQWQATETRKAIEVMHKYSSQKQEGGKHTNQYIRTTLSDRCRYYNCVIGTTKDSHTSEDSTCEFKEKGIKDQEAKEKEFKLFIDKFKKKCDDLRTLDEALEIQQRVIDTLKHEGNPVETKIKEVEQLQQTALEMREKNDAPEAYIRTFLDNLERGAFGGYNLAPSTQKTRFPKNFKSTSREEYLETHSFIQDIFEQYSGDFSPTKTEDKVSDETEELKINPKSPDNHNPNSPTEADKNINEDEKLESEISQKEQQIIEIKAKIIELQKMNEEMANENFAQELSQSYESSIEELLTKNALFSTKIQTLYQKVRKSREKIDNVLKDLYSYQKEFERIILVKKCKPAKMNIANKILQIRLECYKHYLLHLQSGIDELERQIRKLKHQEKLIKSKASLNASQKHNTHADQLKKKIEMLESLIAADSKKKASSKKSKSQAKTGKQSLAKNLKTAKSELKEREDQLKLLSDMLRSSTHQNSMKDQEIERLKKRLRMLSKNAKSTFKAGNQNTSREKNRTGNAFLPGSLRGSVRAEVSFPMSTKAGRGSMQFKDNLPSIKGARDYSNDSLNDYDFDNQKSQASLVISQKRGAKIVNESRQKVKALKETSRMYPETRVTSILPVDGNNDMINLQIKEEDPALEEGTMKFPHELQGDIENSALQGDPEYEEDFQEE